MESFPDAYKRISKQCGCTEEMVKFAKHKCFLKCIRKEDIESWFIHKQNYNLTQAIIILMSLALLNTSLNLPSIIERLENSYEWNLDGLIEIISDYRKWYSNTSTKGEIKGVNERKCQIL